MNHLRSHRHTRLCVLVLHLLVMGVARASPWLRPDDGRLAVRCSASGLATAGADDDATPSLDCPLCLPLQAPPAHAALPVTPSKDKDTRDAAMIAAAQAVEHYEITCRGPTSGQTPFERRWSTPIVKFSDARIGCISGRARGLRFAA